MLQECSGRGAASVGAAGGEVWGGGAAAGCYTPNNPSVDFSLEPPQHPYSGDTAAVNRSHPGITQHRELVIYLTNTFQLLPV